MAREPAKQIVFDPRIESYQSFFDHAWAKTLSGLADGSKLDGLVVSLLANWKSAANTHTMPWLMIASLKGFAGGVLRSQVSASETAVAHLVRQVPEMMRDSLTHTKRRKLAMVMAAIGGRMKTRRECYDAELDMQSLFDEFLHCTGKKELELSLWGSQRMVYGAIYHVYENFVSHCVGLARNEPNYRAPNGKSLFAAAKSLFGDSIATYCLNDRAIINARLVRNALAHHGGKETPELKDAPHGITVVDGEIQVMPNDNRSLFDALKGRVVKLVDAALTLPQCR